VQFDSSGPFVVDVKQHRVSLTVPGSKKRAPHGVECSFQVRVCLQEMGGKSAKRAATRSPHLDELGPAVEAPK
jgi:hypothetical protein